MNIIPATAVRSPIGAAPLCQVYQAPLSPPQASPVPLSTPPRPMMSDAAMDTDFGLHLGRLGEVEPTFLADFVLASPAVPAKYWCHS